MKANRRYIDAVSAEAGVSAVIGAVLLLGIFSTAFLIWSFTTLPVWMADNEQARNEQVEAGFADLRQGLDLMVTGGVSNTLTVDFPLGAQKVPLLQPSPSAGRLLYQDGFDWSASFSSATSHIVDGQVDGNPSEVVNGDILSNVNRLVALELSMTASGISNADWARITVVADDGTDTVTGQMALNGQLFAGNNCEGSEIRFTVTSTFTSEARVTTNCGFGSAVTDHVINGLATDSGLNAQLNRLEKPYDITLTDSVSGGTVDGKFGAVWIDSAEVTKTSGTGVAAGSVSREFQAGRLLFDPLTLQFLDQDIVWEGGATIIAQGSGQAVAQAPNFEMVVSGSTGYIRWTTVDLRGSGEVAGSTVANVQLSQPSIAGRLIESSSGTLSINSTFYQAWENFLNAKILVAGADAAATVTTGTDSVTLTLGSGGGITDWVVHYRVASATAVVQT